jgi:hypothetical protein
MSGQGYHLAVPPEQADALLACDEAGILDFIDGLLDARGGGMRWCGGYKEWDVLHRCLSDGTFDPSGGDPPLNRCFLGGRLLVTQGAIVNLVTPGEVREVAAALAGLDRDWLRGRFAALFAGEYGQAIPEGDVDWYYGLLAELQGFYQTAAERGDAVVFVTDDCLDYFWSPADGDDDASEAGGR